jgi:hypothetical protein
VAASLDEEACDETECDALHAEATADCEYELMPPLTEQVMLRQIDAVTRQLERLERDFEIGANTEIEITWEGGDPFTEAFLEEEVVLDPFLEQSLDIFDNKPLVSAFAGKQLGRSPTTEERAPQIHAFVPKAAPAPAPTAAQSKPAKQPEACAAQNINTASNTIELVFAAPSQTASPATDCKISAACGSKCRTSQVVQLETKLPETTHIAAPQPISKPPVAAPQASYTDSHDEIIIDDGSENESRPMVKRQEYKSLFSKLKRG